MNPKLYIVRGHPGSGKTTIAKAMLNTGIVTAHHEQDDYFTNSDGVYECDRRRIYHAAEHCMTAVKKSLSEGKNTVVCNTFTPLWSLEKYLDIAKEYEAGVVVIHATGNFRNVHDVPENVVQRHIALYEPYHDEIIINPEECLE